MSHQYDPEEHNCPPRRALPDDEYDDEYDDECDDEYDELDHIGRRFYLSVTYLSLFLIGLIVVWAVYEIAIALNSR